MSMYLLIERLDGTKYKTEDYDLKVLDFRISSPSPRHQTEVIEGRNGFLDMGTTYDGREITAEFFVKSADGQDFPLLRNEIFRIFRSTEAFFITDSREPGKRWRVKCASAFTVEQLRDSRGRFEVTFVSDSAYAQSIGTTLDPFTFDAELWQFGQGLEDGELQYTYNSAMFNIFNASDTVINPRHHELYIEFKGASTNLTIKNETTGDEWRYNGTTGVNDTIRLEGVRATKNNLSIFRDTNRKLITLREGWNGFRLTGASGSIQIKFKFRFLYM